MPIGIGTGMAIAGIAGAGASVATGVYGAHQQSSGANYAATLQAQAEEKQRAYLEAKDKQDQANFERTQQLNLDQYNRREGQLAPYRAQGEAANRTLANWLNLDGQGGASYLPAATDYRNGGKAAPTPDISGDSAMFMASMQKHGLDPVAVQGHGKDIVAALKADYPTLDVTVDPKTDAVVWRGVPLDVTIDSGKGGWSFRPSYGPGSGTTTATTTAPTGYRPFTGYGSPAPTLANLSASRTPTPPTMTLNELVQMMGMN